MVDLLLEEEMDGMPTFRVATLSTMVVAPSLEAGREIVVDTEGEASEDLIHLMVVGPQSLAATAETTLVTVATKWASLTGSTRTGV